MPQIETWPRLPAAIRDHLVERMRDRNIGLEDLNQLRLWMEAKPEVPEGLWFKDFGSFKLCGEGKLPKTFLLAGHSAKGHKLSVVGDVSTTTHQKTSPRCHPERSEGSPTADVTMLLRGILTMLSTQSMLCTQPSENAPQQQTRGG